MNNKQVGKNGKLYCLDTAPKFIEYLNEKKKKLGFGDNVIIKESSPIDLDSKKKKRQQKYIPSFFSFFFPLNVFFFSPFVKKK